MDKKTEDYLIYAGWAFLIVVFITSLLVIRFLDRPFDTVVESEQITLSMKRTDAGYTFRVFNISGLSENGIPENDFDSISWAVFDPINNYVVEQGQLTGAGRVLYNDTNSNGRFDIGDGITLLDSDHQYHGFYFSLYHHDQRVSFILMFSTHPSTV